MQGRRSVGAGSATVMSIAVVVLVAASGIQLAGQVPEPTPERIEDRPNLSGIWQAVNEAH